MSRVFRFNGPVTYIENNYEGVGLQHKNSEVSSEKKNDSDGVVFEQSVKVKCSSSATSSATAAGRTAEVLFPDKNGGKDVELTKKMAADLLKKGRTNVKGMWSPLMTLR